jgi:hypothetical protein
MKLRRIGTILGAIGVLLSIPCSVFACFAGSFQRSTVTPVSIISGLWWLIVWVILLIARRWTGTGGALLILASIPYFFFVIILQFGLFTLPYLVVPLLLISSGILFYLSWQASRRESH